MFSSVTSTHRAELDGWRGLAILMVLLDHFAGVNHLGRLGVELFFALSGMLIASILFVDRMPLGLFLRRRAARILPVLYLYLAVVAIATLLFAPEQSLWPVAWASVFLGTYLPGPDIWKNWLPLGHLWSLNIEEHAYLLMAAIAVVLPQRIRLQPARLALTAAAAACVGFYVLHRVLAWTPPGSSPPHLRTECAAFTILASATTHLWLRGIAWRHARRCFALAAIGTVLTMALVTLELRVGGNLIQFIFVPAGLALAVNTLYAAPAALRQALSSPWLRWFGRCSFSLYVWHYPFWIFANRDTFGVGRGTWLVIALVTAVASFYLWEQPMRRWLRGHRHESVGTRPRHTLHGSDSP